MKSTKVLICLFLGLLIVSPLLQAQTAKETEKFWKKKAKGYVKKPLALKAEFENYQNQIKDLKERNKKLVEHMNADGGLTGDNNQADSLRWAVIQLEGELQKTKNDYAKLQAAYQTERKVAEMGIRTGLIYGVQIGAFVFYEMENPPADAQDIIVERADGYNKYVIGNFRTYEEADDFRSELKKMGVKGPWIVPYIDGVRASIEEANTYLKNQGGNY